MKTCRCFFFLHGQILLLHTGNNVAGEEGGGGRDCRLSWNCVVFVSSLSPGAHEKLVLFGSRFLLLLQSLSTESHKHLPHSCALQKPWVLDELFLCISLTRKLSDQVLIYRSMSMTPYVLYSLLFDM